MVNLEAITQGWKNYIFPSPEIEALAQNRAKICATCPHSNPNKVLPHMMPDRTITTIQGLGCDLCGCPLSTKLRQVVTHCPDEPARW